VTTAVTGLVDTLRGSDHWLGYLVVDGRPVWTAGWELATSPGLVVVTTLVAAAGCAGLLLPGLPDRRWLLGGGAARHGAGLGRAHRRAHRPAGAEPAVGAGRLAGARCATCTRPTRCCGCRSRSAWRTCSRCAGRAAAAAPAVAGAARPRGAGRGGRGRAPGRGRAGRGDAAAGVGQRPGAHRRVRGHPGVLAAGRGLARPARRRRAHAAAARPRNAPVYRWGTPRDEPLQALASGPGRSATAPRSARRAAPGCSTASTPGWPPASRPPRTRTCWPGPGSGSCCCATTSTRTGPGPSGRRWSGPRWPARPG
jgi:hypothetical protein